MVLGPGVQPATHKGGKEPHWAHIKEDRRNPVTFTIRFRSRGDLSTHNLPLSTSTNCPWDALQKLKIIPKDIYPYVVDLTDDSSPNSPKIKLEDGVDEDDRSPTQPLDEDDHSPTQPLDGSAGPDAAENASDGTKIKREHDFWGEKKRKAMEYWPEVTHHTRKNARKDKKPSKTWLKVKTPGKKDSQARNCAECNTAQIATTQASECAWIEARNSFTSVGGFKTGKGNKW
jgi:hypothetical protein